MCESRSLKREERTRQRPKFRPPLAGELTSGETEAVGSTISDFLG